MKLRLDISGMSCEHCVKHVTEILSEIEGLTVLEVEINNAIISVDERVTEAIVKEVIEDAGFDLNGIMRVGD